jgi:hypothetical protein
MENTVDEEGGKKETKSTIIATEKYRQINCGTSYGHSSEILAKIPERD